MRVVNIKQAKTDLSKLFDEAIAGHAILIANANTGKRVKLIPVDDDTEQVGEQNLPGYGMLRGLLNLQPGWHTQKSDEADDAETIELFGLNE